MRLSNPAVRALLASLLILGCTDKAKPDFDRCVQLEQEKKFEDAIKACQIATSKDPGRESGKLAQARVPVLKTEDQEAARQEAARLAAVASQQQDAAERLKAARAKYDEASAREAALRAQLGQASTPEEKQRIQTQIDQAVAAEKAVMGNKPGSKCPPGDPMCGDL